LSDDLAALGGEWPELWQSDPAATPFASFQWLTAWCSHWAEGGKPWILLAYDGERLAGAAPFLLRRRGGLRLLNGLGVGVGNYWDVIAAPEDSERVMAAVAKELVKRSSEWDAFFLDKLPEESTTIAAMQKAGLRTEDLAQMVSPRIELPETFEEYLMTLSSKRRRDLRRCLDKFDGGELTVRSLSDPAELRAAIERWQELKVEWWTRREQAMNPEHASPRFLEFTRDVVSAMVPLGLASVWELSRDGEVVAIAIGLLDDSTYYGWLFGFDWRLEDMRPGHLMIAYGIRWAVEQRLRYYDFMLGSESYKYHYAPRDRAVLMATIGSPRLRSRATLALTRARQAVRPKSVSVPGLAGES
jgi:CelD/BcsL family acetyltransferase involved in cellulose biosynthesis